MKQSEKFAKLLYEIYARHHNVAVVWSQLTKAKKADWLKMTENLIELEAIVVPGSLATAYPDRTDVQSRILSSLAKGPRKAAVLAKEVYGEFDYLAVNSIHVHIARMRKRGDRIVTKNRTYVWEDA